MLASIPTSMSSPSHFSLAFACRLLLLLAVAVSPALAAEQEQPPPTRTEPGVVPIIVYSSDQGLGLGAMGNLAHFEPDYDPYRWRVRVNAVAFRRLVPSSVRWPLVAAAIGVDLPGLAEGKLRLDLLAYYLQHNNCAWYGLGNASSVASTVSDEWYWYVRRRPGARIRALVTLPHSVEAFALLGVSHTTVQAEPDSKLSHDAAGIHGDDVASMIVGMRPHLLTDLAFGITHDTRDNEFWPTEGLWNEISLRAGVLVPEQAEFAGANLALRGYLPALHGGLVFAQRLIADGIVGSPPFYELSRFGGSQPGNGPGGHLVGRGFGLRRFHGKVKLLSTTELRAQVWNFQLTGLNAQFGPTGFLDLGRIWSDWSPDPELDGSGLGLLVSGGGGVRLRWGESFVIRADLGFSREGRGLYFGAGHVF